MENKKNYYIVFPNVNEAMHLDKRLTENGVYHLVAPTPREFSNSCGISIKYNFEDREKIEKIAEENKINVLAWSEQTKK